MYGFGRDDERGRVLLLIPQIVTLFFLIRIILLVRSHWRGVLNYQAYVSHSSLPSGAQDSEHTMMICVRPENTQKILDQ